MSSNSPKLLYYCLAKISDNIRRKNKSHNNPEQPQGIYLDFFLTSKFGGKHAQVIEIPALVRKILIKIAPKVIPGVVLKEILSSILP